MNPAVRLLCASALLAHAHAFARISDARTVQRAFDVAPNASSFTDLRDVAFCALKYAAD